MKRLIKVGLPTMAIAIGAAYFYGVPLREQWEKDRASAAKEQQKIETETAILRAEAELKSFCSSTETAIVKNTDRDVDGGTKAHAHATATIKAPKGYFIMSEFITN